MLLSDLALTKGDLAVFGGAAAAVASTVWTIYKHVTTLPWTRCSITSHRPRADSFEVEVANNGGKASTIILIEIAAYKNPFLAMIGWSRSRSCYYPNSEATEKNFIAAGGFYRESFCFRKGFFIKAPGEVESDILGYRVRMSHRRWPLCGWVQSQY